MVGSLDRAPPARTGRIGRSSRAVGRVARPAWLALAGAIALGAAPAGAQVPEPPDLTNLSLEQLAEVDVVYAASKHPESRREAPAYVSIVTSEEIRQFGWRTLGDVLRSLPSFYVTDDRNYSYVGVRGFDRPGDYSTRILLLLDGLRTNNNIYDQAFVGSELVVDADLIDRIEVIRGPGASRYGNSAFFAVINVVTKRGGALQGGEIAASVAGSGSWGGRATWGRRFSNGLQVLASASLAGRHGERLYFREFDAPQTNFGVTEGTDDEASRSGFFSLSNKGLLLEAAHAWREKGIPTGSFATDFNDPHSRTWDESTLVQLSHVHAVGQSLTTLGRLHYGRYAYTGHYASAGSFSLDQARGEWWGIDVTMTWSGLPRQKLTFGGEWQENFRQDQIGYSAEPREKVMDLHFSNNRWGVFVQDEVTLRHNLRLHAGLRHDRYDTVGGRTSPRVGLVWDPDSATTQARRSLGIKLAVRF